MNRRNFLSLLLGAAGGGVVLWRMPKPRIFLPARERVYTLVDNLAPLVTVDARAVEQFRNIFAASVGVPSRFLYAEGQLAVTPEEARAAEAFFADAPSARHGFIDTIRVRVR